MGTYARLDEVVSYIEDQVENLNLSSETSTGLLLEKAAEIRASRINWQSYVQGQMISNEDFEVISRLDFATNAVPENRLTFFTQNPDLCVVVLFRLLRRIAKEQTLQYILTMIDDLLSLDKNLVDIFKQHAMTAADEPAWTPFMDMLSRTDAFIVNQSSRILSKFACWSRERMPAKELDFYLRFLRTHLIQPGNEYVNTVGRCLQTMLRIDDYRHAFVASDGISTIVNVLSGSAGKLTFQIQYQLIFCLWCLTFNSSLANRLAKYNVIPILCDIITETVKEKVIRIILATLRNCLEKPSEREIIQQNALSMIQCKVMKQLQLFEGRKFEDEDILEDMAFINEALAASVDDFSSFDEYSSEVRSGRLEWSPVHKEERFWRENAARLNEKNYELLKMLIHLLETARDPLLLCVAAHDLGEYVRHYPRGKRVIEQLGGKQIVMQHLTHDHPNVRYQALLAVQKLMVHNWEYLGRQIQEPSSEGNNQIAVK